MNRSKLRGRPKVSFSGFKSMRAKLALVVVVVVISALIDKTRGEEKRISQLKCEEYRKLVDKNTCVNNDKPPSGKAKPGEYPHMALIGFKENGKSKWRGSGVLISDEYVLTVVICTYHRAWGEAEEVRLGEIDIESMSDGTEIENIKIAEIIQHPKFQPPKKYNYLALLRLEKPVTFNSFIRPACLPHYDYNFNDRVYTMTGWGLIAFGNMPEKMNLMHDSYTEFVSHEKCNKIYSARALQTALPQGIHNETQICFLDRKTSCQIPSGAPLNVHNKETPCMNDVVAFLSFGLTLCNDKNPSVFTKIAPSLDWIESIVWP